MIITFWILAIIFGLVALAGWRKFFLSSGLTIPELILCIFSTLIAAVSIGVISAGGLFNTITIM